MTLCVFSPEAQFVCKDFLKCIVFKRPHWGCSECTGWKKTPNTVLYMEEKPRGEKSFWLVSTDWPWSEGNQEVSAAQHQDRKASGTISTYFRGAGGAIYYPEQVAGGLSVTLMCKQLRGIRCRPAFTLMINHSAFSACLAFLTSDPLQCSVIIQHSDWSHFCIRIVKNEW